MTPLTIRAAAERLGVGYSTLKRWVHSGTVRTTRTGGGHHRVSEAEIERLSSRQQPEGRHERRFADEESGLAELSARNRLRGFVEEVRIDGLLAQVRLRVGDQRLTAVITADAVRALRLRRGDDAVAIVKSTEVMIGRLPRGPATSTKASSRRQKTRTRAARPGRSAIASARTRRRTRTR
jgi:molybdopterin-binding protein